jgi:hypothetical protein
MVRACRGRVGAPRPKEEEDQPAALSAEQLTMLLEDVVLRCRGCVQEKTIGIVPASIRLRDGYPVARNDNKSEPNQR